MLLDVIYSFLAYFLIIIIFYVSYEIMYGMRWWLKLLIRKSCVRNRRVRQVAVFLVISAFVAIAVWSWPDEKKMAREEKYQEILESWRIRQACKLPEMEVFSQEIMKYIKPVNPIVCDGEKDWVEVDGCTAYITPKARRKHGQIYCKFTDLNRISDFVVRPGSSTNSSKYRFIASDFVRVECQGKSGQTWSNILAGARCFEYMDSTGWDKTPKRAMKMNVLMFGFDSVSRLNFIRKLPLSYDFLTRELGAIVLQGYNIVGDGTPQAIIPMLTGKTERELPETRKRKRKSTHVNVYPFLWKKFMNAGYITGYMEDTPSAGIFTYRLKGFKDVPTDHYMRTFFVDAEQNYYEKFSKNCLGSKPRHQAMMDYIKSVFKVHKNEPKFVFGFQGEISHNDLNMVGAADVSLLDWLKWYKKEHWKDTVLILMSDHGNRYGPSRATQQGKLEERLPFFSFAFPPWFGQHYPKALKNFRTNTRRLTTPFDIHATLDSILDPPSFGLGNLSHRGISLFQEVPPSRTCKDAFIEPHWCACLEWQSLDKYDPVANTAGEFLVQRINGYNARYSNQCELMGLRHVAWAAKLVPSEAFRKFRKTKDKDGFIADMRGKMTVTAVMYQIQFVTDPGPAVFEAAVTYDLSVENFSFRIEEVSRVNEYGPQAKCLPDKLEHLRKFCYCKFHT